MVSADKGGRMMKDCPRCRMTVDAHSECPICKADLVGVPYSDCERERYRLNRYLIPVLLKRGWVPLLASAVILLRVLLFGIEINIPFLCMLVCLVCAFVCVLFPNWKSSFARWKYSEDYLDSTAGKAKIIGWVLAVLAVFFAIVNGYDPQL